MFGKMHVLGCWARLGVQLLYLLGLMHDLGAEHLAELRQLPKRAFYAARALHAPDPPSQAGSCYHHRVKAQPSPFPSLSTPQEGSLSTSRRASAPWSRKREEAGRS